jgi:hypothetical protein
MHAITMIPCTSDATPPRMLCLQYYRSGSDGCRHIGQCDDCVTEKQLALLPLNTCHRQESCACTICERQPPSLAHLASYVLANYTLSLKRLALNVNTTDQQYVYASHSPQVPVEARLPPNMLTSVYFSALNRNRPSDSTVIALDLPGGIRVRHAHTGLTNRFSPIWSGSRMCSGAGTSRGD